MNKNAFLTLDCQGLACPEPVIRTRTAVQNGCTDLIVLVDNEPSSQNVSRFLGRSGFAVSVEKRGEALYAVSGHAACAACTEAEEIIQAADVSSSSAKRTVVMLTTEFLGFGSDELGEKLMANFISTLPEMGENLWRIVMLNGGVKLSAKPGKSLDGLKKLAASGVSILVCGTCLEYYGLLDAKEVGETTNMLDIVTSLDLADKVIRP